VGRRPKSGPGGVSVGQTEYAQAEDLRVYSDRYEFCLADSGPRETLLSRDAGGSGTGSIAYLYSGSKGKAGPESSHQVGAQFGESASHERRGKHRLRGGGIFSGTWG